MITKKTKYGVKALIYLGRRYQTGPIGSSQVAIDLNIPQKFLEAILLELRKIGVLSSKKGSGGGYYLIKPPAEVSLEDLIRHLNGPISLLPCVSLRFYEKCEECMSEDECSMNRVMIEVRDKTLEIFRSKSLQDLMDMEGAAE